MSGLIWVQTVCKDYQQMTLVGKELRINEVLYVKVVAEWQIV